MKRGKPSISQPKYDYALALQRAVSWLGDRYVLAQPVNRRVAENKPYFAESRAWHPASRH